MYLDVSLHCHPIVNDDPVNLLRLRPFWMDNQLPSEGVEFFPGEAVSQCLPGKTGARVRILEPGTAYEEVEA